MIIKTKVEIYEVYNSDNWVKIKLAVALNNDYQKALIQKENRFLCSLNYHLKHEKHCLGIFSVFQLY